MTHPTHATPTVAYDGGLVQHGLSAAIQVRAFAVAVERHKRADSLMAMFAKTFAVVMLSFPALSLWASDTPLSGTFSNVKNTEVSGYTASMKNKVNLVVTIGRGGQQFFIQCFKGEKAGFGVVTVLKTPQREAKIKAGPECPAREVSIQLDYEEALLRIGSGFIYLPRGNIHVPIEP